MSEFLFPTIDRNAWVLSQRGTRALVNSSRPYGFFVEDECSRDGDIAAVATIFLTNRECPWRCVMCDLWKNTLPMSVNVGDIPKQIDHALARMAPAEAVKLYNSGSFFDKKAIPVQDHPAIAHRLKPFRSITVESHPALIGKNTLHFRDLLQGRLEVAMGLETAHPEVLEYLNKGMTLDQFSAAAAMLRRNEIDLRTFILVQPPFLHPSRALHWAERSLDFAFANGASVATLIPTRVGNGAMESLERDGLFTKPTMQMLEDAVTYGLGLQQGRVFSDLWDLEIAVSCCSSCFEARRARLHTMNLTQQVLPPIRCPDCRS